MKSIAIITARSGSKGLRDKNIKQLGNVPLMAYTIKAALESELFDKVHVSTDSQEYRQIALEYGADVPFLRDLELSGDTASSIDTVRWVLEEYHKRGYNFRNSALLQPTSPFRSSEDLKAAMSIFESKNASAVISVTEAENPAWVNTLPENHSLLNFIHPRLQNKPRQQLEQHYKINGAIYIFDNEFISRNNNLYQENTYAYIMPKERSVDIDDEFDFMIAETLLCTQK